MVFPRKIPQNVFKINELRDKQFSGSDDGVNPQPGPLSWMKRAIRGERSVLIVNRRAAWNALGGVVDLQAETIEDGDRLERLITPPRQVRSNIVLGVIQ